MRVELYKWLGHTRAQSLPSFAVGKLARNVLLIDDKHSSTRSLFLLMPQYALPGPMLLINHISDYWKYTLMNSLAEIKILYYTSHCVALTMARYYAPGPDMLIILTSIRQVGYEPPLKCDALQKRGYANHYR